MLCTSQRQRRLLVCRALGKTLTAVICNLEVFGRAEAWITKTLGGGFDVTVPHTLAPERINSREQQNRPNMRIDVTKSYYVLIIFRYIELVNY